MADEIFLSRWSRLKARSRQGEEAPPPAAPASPAVPAAAIPPQPAREEAPLPPVESLTGDSDFTPFMKEGVDPNLRRQALRTLLHDPRFNVMDGLDVYIDDYSKPDPLPAGWLEQLNQVARLGEYHEPEPEEEAAGSPPASLAEVASDGQGAPVPADALPADTSATSDRAPEVDDSSRSAGGW